MPHTKNISRKVGILSIEGSHSERDALALSRLLNNDFPGTDLVAFGMEYNYPSVGGYCSQRKIDVVQHNGLEGFARGIIDGRHINKIRLLYIPETEELGIVPRVAEMLDFYWFNVVTETVN